MTDIRKNEALSACEKFLIKSKWNFQTGLVADLWLAAVEWADNNLSNVCSTKGLGDVHFSGIRFPKTKFRNKAL